MSERVDRVCDLAEEAGLADADLLTVYRKIREAIGVAFNGDVDSGVGGSWCDFWVRHDGVEYKLVLKPHRCLKVPS